MLDSKKRISDYRLWAKIPHYVELIFLYDFYFMTFNIVLFLPTTWYSQKVQAGLEPRALSVFCVWKVRGCFVRCIDSAFCISQGDKRSVM